MSRIQRRTRAFVFALVPEVHVDGPHACVAEVREMGGVGVEDNHWHAVLEIVGIAGLPGSRADTLVLLERGV